jgi:hypothetical protein
VLVTLLSHRCSHWGDKGEKSRTKNKIKDENCYHKGVEINQNQIQNRDPERLKTSMG